MRSTKVQFRHFSRNVYSEVRERGELLDLTLVCDDQTSFSAHKLVLAAHSDLLRKYLVATPGQASLFMFNVNGKDLANILHFLYTGEVDVPQLEVARFISLAQKLGISDLAPRETEPPLKSSRLELEEAEEAESHECEICEKRFSSRVSLDSHRLTHLRENSTNNIKWNLVQVTHQDQPLRETQTLTEDQERSSREVELGPEDLEEAGTLQEYLATMFSVGQTGQEMRCKVCQKVTGSWQEAEEHASGHISGLAFPCKHCQQLFSSRSSLTSHRLLCPGEGPPSWAGARLYPPNKGKRSSPSPVWRFGGFVMKEDGLLDKSQVVCAVCGKCFKYYNSPSTLRNHLRNQHPSVLYESGAESLTGEDSTEDPEMITADL